MDIDKLLSLLKEVDNSNLPDSYDYILHSNDLDIITDIEILATNTLIDQNGMNVYSYHEYLRSNGFSISPGERDRFGWLSGRIHTKKGIIIYE